MRSLCAWNTAHVFEKNYLFMAALGLVAVCGLSLIVARGAYSSVVVLRLIAMAFLVERGL